MHIFGIYRLIRNLQLPDFADMVFINMFVLPLIKDHLYFNTTLRGGLIRNLQFAWLCWHGLYKHVCITPH